MKIDGATSQEISDRASYLRSLRIVIERLKMATYDDAWSSTVLLGVRPASSDCTHDNEICITEDIATALISALEAEASVRQAALVRLVTAGDDDPIE